MIPNCLAWKNENVGVYDASKGVYRRLSRHRMKGISDILGIYYGRMLCIEVKTETGRVSPEQKHFLEEMAKLGAIAFVARSLDDVLERLPRMGPSVTNVDQK
jgi:hypothetical protein